MSLIHLFNFLLLFTGPQILSLTLSYQVITTFKEILLYTEELKELKKLDRCYETYETLLFNMEVLFVFFKAVSVCFLMNFKLNIFLRI